MNGETNLSQLIKNMQPVLNDGLYIFCSLPSIAELDLDKILFFFKEKEGFTVVIEKEYADSMNWADSPIYAWITLKIHSSLEAVGLTAAFSNALANYNISCNVVAGYFHDHIFVQQEKADQALDILKNLSVTYGL